MRTAAAVAVAPSWTTRVATTDPRHRPAGRLTPKAAGERLSELFAQHGRMVYGLCRVLLRGADEAEDAAQQVFLSAHRSILGGTEPKEPAAWLAAIARNECRARIRKRMVTPLELVVDERDAVGADTERLAGERAEVDALCAALAELPRQQREAIVLREFYGLSYEEVRVALGVTDGAVESLLFRARKRLQAELQPARVAMGALALPLALRDALAAAVPGFSASSGGGLAKLASVPLLAKLAAAAATVTAAGTIGYVELDARDHDPIGPPSSVPKVRAESRPIDQPVRFDHVSLEQSPQPAATRYRHASDKRENAANELDDSAAEVDGRAEVENEVTDGGGAGVEEAEPRESSPNSSDG
jgi:RNA polymerase sigma factor (sigma-70 family)